MIQDSRVYEAIKNLGNEAKLEVLEASCKIFEAEQSEFVAQFLPIAENLSYGQHTRQVLDIYVPAPHDKTVLKPVLVWIHGGGFVRGGKSNKFNPFDAHIGRFAARHDMIGVTMNYRLAPEFVWPAGGEDVGIAVSWLRHNISTYGGDPDAIYIMGTSAGACHISTYLRLFPETKDIRAAIMLSGLYGYTALDPRDQAYYNGVEEIYASTLPFSKVLESDLPLFIACAGFDPMRFQTETLFLLNDIFSIRGKIQGSCILSGHNHYSMSLHIGGSDTRLSDQILSFIKTTRF